jgi:hypothetical protein
MLGLLPSAQLLDKTVVAPATSIGKTVRNTLPEHDPYRKENFGRFSGVIGLERFSTPGASEPLGDR